MLRMRFSVSVLVDKCSVRAALGRCVERLSLAAERRSGYRYFHGADRRFLIGEHILNFVVITRREQDSTRVNSNVC